MKDLLTIVVPLYNEEENLPRVGKELSEFIAKPGIQARVLFVNDGSTDKSQELIEQICNQYEKFDYLLFKKNCGLSAAIKAGIDYTLTPFVGYIDADLQTSPEDFELLMKHSSEYEMVTGIRANRKDTFVKKMSSKIANSFRRSMTNDGVEDTGCPLKVLNTEVAKKIPFFKGMHRFLPALVQLQNGKVKQVPVRHFPRIAGTAKFHLGNRLIGPLMDTFAFRWMKKRYINYDVQKTTVNN